MSQKVSLQMAHEQATKLLNIIEALMEPEEHEGVLLMKTAPIQTEDDVPPQESDVGGGVKIPSVEQLAKMQFNKLRTLGAQLGIPSGGKREELEASILALAGGGVAESPKKKSQPEKAAIPKKQPVKKEPEPEPESEPEEEHDSAGISAALEGMSDSEIIAVLEEVGLKTTGKRAALIDRVIAGVESGEIVWVEDDEDDIYQTFPIFQVNDSSQCEIPEDRMNKLIGMDEVFSEKGTGENESDIDAVLVSFLGEQYSAERYEPQQKEIIYLEFLKLFVDDDGEEVDEGDAYFLNDVLYCCGRPLSEGGKCSGCNAEYDV